jgi:hypothetical protein
VIDAPLDPELPQDEPPLSEDDFLIQQYLDGTLDEDTALEVELRLDEDDAFAARLGGYGAMFAALDAAGAQRFAAPLGIAEAAVAQWAPQAEGIRTPDAERASFGSLVGWFVAADVVLAAALVALAVARGPVQLLESWVLGVKDLLLWGLAAVPEPSQLAVLLPTLAVGSMVGLALTGAGARRVLATAEVPT